MDHLSQVDAEREERQRQPERHFWPRANKPNPSEQTRERVQTVVDLKDDGSQEWAKIAQAAQRLTNAATALTRTKIHDPSEEAAFDEYFEAREQLVLMCLRDGKDEQRLISLALDECAKAVQEFH